MKQFLTIIFGSLLYMNGSGQDRLQLATDKTISLIFPFPVVHVDRGTKDLFVQQLKESDNIVLVKAAIARFSETNLSVVTSDGSVYSFRVIYNAHPDSLVFHLPAIGKTTVADYANSILDNQRMIKNIRDHKWKMCASVRGIYVKDGVLYYQLQLCNQSMIDYDIELLKFFIRDKRKAKRTAVQEVELIPIHISGNTKMVGAGESSVIVVALKKFTIPDAKDLVVQIMEKNGGRHLAMKIKNEHIIHAVPLPDMN